MWTLLMFEAFLRNVVDGATGDVTHAVAEAPALA